MRDFPKLDDEGEPVGKMPCCPRCLKDTLIVANKDLVLCLKCAFKVERYQNFSCLCKCGINVPIKQDMDNPYLFHLNCCCGHKTGIKVDSETARMRGLI
jgi:hypothetical protein